MTAPIDTAELRRLLAAASTPNQWYELREALHRAAPNLLDELDRLRAENERLRARVKKFEKVMDGISKQFELSPNEVWVCVAEPYRAALEGSKS